jgi:hypothetical protein
MAVKHVLMRNATELDAHLGSLVCTRHNDRKKASEPVPKGWWPVVGEDAGDEPVHPLAPSPSPPNYTKAATLITTLTVNREQCSVIPIVRCASKAWTAASLPPTLGLVLQRYAAVGKGAGTRGCAVGQVQATAGFVFSPAAAYSVQHPDEPWVANR